jgi:hypothetical protein
MKYKYHALFYFILILSYSCGAVISGKAPVVTGIASGLITISNRNNIYTAPIDGSGNYRFQDVASGLYALKSEIPGYNLVNTVSVDTTVAASVTVPELAIEKYISGANNYSYTWIQDQSYAGLPKTDLTQNIVKPVAVNVLGKAYEMADVSYSQELFDKYGITLSNSLSPWTQEYAYRLYVVLGRIPQISGTDYRYNSNLNPTIWTLTTDAIADDIEIGSGVNAGLIRISTAAFTYAAPLVVEIEGVRGLYFSKRLHHALVNFVTKGGTDQIAVAKILSDRFGLTIDTDANRLNYSLFTSEASSRFQNWFKHPAEIVDIINNFEELPEGMHKIPGFKWLVRRLDGTVNPVYPDAPAIAWTGGYMEFMESAFKNFDVSYISKLILHEKAHYIYQFILTAACKKEWANLGGWQYSPNPSNPNYDATGGWQTTKTTEFVSAYAHDKNPNEDFAESIAAFVKNPDILKARSISKYNFLRDTVMLSNSYVSIIRPDLTFTVLNLYPSYDYPGKIKRIATTVTGAADADKTLTVEIEITPFSTNSNPAKNIFARIMSPVSVAYPVATYFDMQFDAANKEGTIFRSTQILSKYIRSGYWQMPNVRIVDTVGLERYESSLLYGFKCYINNPLEDIIAPQVLTKSASITLKTGTEAGHPVQIATVKFTVTENTGLNYHYATLVPPNAYALEKYGTGVTFGTGERTIDFYIRDYAPTGRYTLNQISLKDLGLNLNYTYFKTSSGNSDGTTINLDENAPTIDIVTPNPDYTAPELDVNRISVKAVPTNSVTPDGETLVTIEYYARDDISGYGSGGNLKLRDPQGIEHRYPTYHRNWYTDYFDGDPRAWEKYVFQVILPRGSVPGIWGLSQMTLIDKAGQAKGYDFTETVRFDPNSTAAADLQITQDPVGKTYKNGDTVALSVRATGGDKVSYEWFKDGVSLLSGKKTSLIVADGLPPDLVNPPQSAVYLSAGTSTLQITGAGKAEAGNYYCIISNASGRVISKAVDLVFSTDSTPMITTQPSAGSVTSGSSVNFTVGASGTAPLTYQWKKDGAVISGATSSTYTIVSTKTTDAGSYTVVVTNSVGSVTSGSATLAVTAPRLSNLSVRTALDANQIVIVGVTMSGGAKNVLLRAVGPTLSAFGVPSVMADPKLDLYSGSTKVTTNDNWGGSTVLSSAFQSVGAFAYSSTTSLDAALVTSIDGGRTVQVSGPTAGTVLVEGYDAGSGDTQRFTNLSARNKVGTGANILIAGFTLTGSGNRNLLIRAVGPKLSDFGVTGVLTDPKLEIYSGSTKVTENDNWSSSLAMTFSSVGAFGLTAGSKDAAITVSLPAGGYTVQVSGADGGVGEAIVEIYELP